LRIDTQILMKPVSFLEYFSDYLARIISYCHLLLFVNEYFYSIFIKIIAFMGVSDFFVDKITFTRISAKFLQAFAWVTSCNRSQNIVETDYILIHYQLREII